jgi:hypothetical protein
VLVRHFRSHFIPLHHDGVKHLLSRSSEEILTALVQQIEDLRLEVESQRQRQSAKGEISAAEDLNDFLENDQLVLLAKAIFNPWGTERSEKKAAVTSQQQVSAAYVLPLALQQETNLSFSLPPFELTYQLYYAIYHLKDAVFNPSTGQVLLKVLQKWVDLLDASSLAHANRVLMRSHQWTGSHFKAFLGSRQKAPDRDDPSSLHDLRRYLELVSDLATFCFLLRSQLLDCFCALHDSYPPRIEPSSTASAAKPSAREPLFKEAGPSATPPAQGAAPGPAIADALRESCLQFAYLPFRLRSLATSRQIDEARDVEEEELTAFLRSHLPLLNADMVLALCVRMEWMRCVSAVMEHVEQLLGIDPDEIREKLKVAAAASSAASLSPPRGARVLGEQANPSLLRPSSGTVISPKKRLSPMKPPPSAASSLLPVRNASLFSSPQSGLAAPSSSAFNQKLQRGAEELVFLDRAATPFLWLAAFQRFLGGRSFLLQERQLAVFVLLLPLLMEHNSWLSLELLVNHFHPFLTPFLVKTLLFEKDRDLVRVRWREEGSCLVVLEEANDFHLLVFYFDYLTKVIRSHCHANCSSDFFARGTSLLVDQDEERGGGGVLVNEWLELSLLLSHGQPVLSDAEDEPWQPQTLSPSWRKTAAVCVKSIVNADRQHFSFSLPRAMAVCLRFQEFEAVLQIFQKHCQQARGIFEGGGEEEGPPGILPTMQEALRQLLRRLLESLVAADESRAEALRLLLGRYLAALLAQLCPEPGHELGETNEDEFSPSLLLGPVGRVLDDLPEEVRHGDEAVCRWSRCLCDLLLAVPLAQDHPARRSLLGGLVALLAEFLPFELFLSLRPSEPTRAT